jgi:predicted CxxxxCH...CXXCH cytochrome family protein
MNNYSTLGANNNFACVECHASTVSNNQTIGNPANHGNGLINYSGVKAGKITVVNSGKCNNNYCHSTGQKADVATFWNMTAANWYSGRKLDCTGCHGNAQNADFAPVAGVPNYPNGGVGSPTANSHNKHVTTLSITDTKGCAKCHAKTVDSGAANKLRDYSSSHLNRTINVNIQAAYGGTFNGTAGNKTCDNVYCHSNGAGGAALKTAQWGDTLSCSGCHAFPPIYTNGSPKANSHDKHNINCGYCHAATTTDAGTITGKLVSCGLNQPCISTNVFYDSPIIDVSKHVNGSYDVVAGNDASFTYSYAENGGTCSTISCHNDGTAVATSVVNNLPATWGTTTNCSGCHGFPPAYVNGLPKANSHSAHASYSFGCNRCHYGTTYNGTVISDTNKHANHAYDVSAPLGDTLSYTFAATGGTCTNSYCHSNGVSVAISVIPTNNAPKWGTVGPLACNSCHGFPPAYASGTPKANSHANHSFGCNYCHAGTTSDGATVTGKALHVNGSYDITAGSGATFTYTYAATGGSCSNISCHGNTSATWGSTLGCATCHGNPPPNAVGSYTAVNETTSPHMKHAGATGSNYSFSCNECHKGNAHGTGTFQDVFIDKSGIVAGSAATYTTATRTCSTLYCHSNGTSVATGQPASGSVAWDSNKLACNGCHGNPPAYANNTPKANNHGSHSFGCGTCHAGTTTDGTTISGINLHVNGAYNVTPGTGTTFAYTYASTGGTCSNISCHQGVNAKWGSSVNHTANLGSGYIDVFAGSNNHDDGQETVNEECALCHSANIVVQHNNNCSICHAGANPAGAIIASGGWNKTCEACHTSYHTNIDHDAVVNLNDCTQCHSTSDPWGSYGTSTGDNCGWCHSPDQTKAIFSQNHPAPVDTPPTASKGNLKLQLHMDEASWNGVANEVKDNSGSNNNGTAHNATTVGGGTSGRAGSFNGYSSSISIKYSSGTQPADNFTLEAWVKPNATHEIDAENNFSTNGISGEKYLFWPDYSGNYDGGAGVSVGTNGISVYEHGNGYMPALAVYSGAISSSQWTHIAVVYSNKQPSIYVNGSLVHIGQQSQRRHVYAPQTIGGGVYGWYSGLADEAAIYDAALSANEILQHAQQVCTSTANTTETIKWTSTIVSSSYVDYGLTTSYGTTVGNDSLVNTHIVTLPGLADNTTYHYRVRSVAAGGFETTSGDFTFNNSKNCNPISIAPSAPTNISVTPGTNQLTVSWTPGANSSSSLIQYGLTSGTYTATIDPTSIPQVITGFPGGAPVYLKVGSKNNLATAWSSAEYSATPTGLPAAPTNISAIPGNNSATISWTPGVGSTSSQIRYGYWPYYYSMSYSVIPATSPTTVTNYIYNTNTYYFQVGATNAYGTTWNDTFYPVSPAAQKPTVNSPTATSVTSTSALLGANVADNGGFGLTARGTCWGSTSAPTTNCLAQGSTSTGVFTQARTGLTEGSVIYYRGYATNSASTGYSTDGTIYTEPTQPTTLSYNGVGTNGMTVNWVTGSTGNAKNVIVLMKSGSAVAADPADGTTYTANAAFGSGTQIGSTGYYVVYKGTGTSVAVTGLAAGTTYQVKVYAFASGAAGTENYNLSVPLTGSPSTTSGGVVVPTLTTPTATAVASTTATLGANVTANGGGALTANGTCWGLTSAPTANCVDYGTHTTGTFTQNRTSLTEGSLIYYRGYATNSAGTAYSPDGTIYTEPAQSNTLSYTSVGSNGITVNWATASTGNAKNVIVLMKAGSAVAVDPVDGTTYTASPAFGSGAQIGSTGYYVVYKGTGTSVAVTGLTASTTYQVKVYALAVGAAGTENYNLTVPLTGSPSTSAAVVPTLTTPTATVVASTTATLGANVTSNGGAALSANGTCWGLAASPLTNCLDQGSHLTGVFTQGRTGLTEGSLIYYRGYATNFAGTAYSPDGTIYTEPTQPNTLSFTGIGTAGVTVNWVPVSSGNAKNVIVLMKAGSVVSADPVDGTSYTASTTFGSGTQIGSTGYFVVYKGPANSVAVTGLTLGTTYQIKVYSFAAGAAGTENYNTTSPLTGSQATFPSAPTGISAAAGNGQITINWTAGTGSTSSNIRYGTVSGTYPNLLTAVTSPRIITGLTNGTTIYYQVAAVNGSGTTWSGEFNVTPVLSLPSAPSGILAVPGNAQATISWTDGTDATSSLIRYGTTSGSYTTSIDPATSPRIITGLTNGTIIYYQVGARNAAGTSWSLESSFTPNTVQTIQIPISYFTDATESGGIYDDQWDTMWVGPFDGWDVDRSFIMFNTSLGAGVSITSARLHLDYEDNSYMDSDSTTNVYASTWTTPGDGSTYDNIGAFLAQNYVSGGQSHGLTSFDITPAYINRIGMTKFALRADDEDHGDYYNADPGYSRAGSYLEITYTSN